MKVNAKYFGTVSYEEDEVISITNGLFGFESYTRYLPLPFEEDDDALISLQSLENEELSFILMNPFKLLPGYSPVLPNQDKEELEISSETDIAYYVISVIRDTVSESTVNLKAPLVINVSSRKSKQVILEQPEYTFRHTLSSIRGKEEL